MKRYTHKLTNTSDLEKSRNLKYFLIPDIEECDNAENKLGQLEDLEEKIEMPLIKFLEWRIEDKLPYCVIEGKIKKVAHYSWLIERNMIEVWDANLKKRYRFHFRDYGKTWALDKKDLTNE